MYESQTPHCRHVANDCTRNLFLRHSCPPDEGLKEAVSQPIPDFNCLARSTFAFFVLEPGCSSLFYFGLVAFLSCLERPGLPLSNLNVVLCLKFGSENSLFCDEVYPQVI